MLSWILTRIADWCARPRADRGEEWLRRFACDARGTDIAVAAFSFLLVVVTVGLVVVGVVQWWLTRDSARRQLRAYVFI